jgi:hypothetical protein
MKAFRSIPRAARRSHWRLVLPGIPSEGTLLQIPSSGSNLESESWPSGGCRLKSITASAGETFAGIFGFLSPVLGPAAAGPAAAGEATVLSVATGMASFAGGSWSLPSDMIAQVHQGEMVVPAGPASTFRSMMESNSGVAGTVHVHHATNFNVSAMDSQSVRQFLKTNSKQIMRTINESVRTGSHIGLSKLRAT